MIHAGSLWLVVSEEEEESVESVQESVSESVSVSEKGRMGSGGVRVAVLVFGMALRAGPPGAASELYAGRSPALRGRDEARFPGGEVVYGACRLELGSVGAWRADQRGMVLDGRSIIRSMLLDI